MANGTSTDLVSAVNADPALQSMLDALPSDARVIVVQKIAGAVKKHGRSAGGAITPSVGGGPTGQRFRLWNLYYSIVRFQAAVSVVGAVTTLTFVSQILRAFSYAINDSLVGAGFDPTMGNATDAETNLVSKAQTIGGEQVSIGGLSLMPSSVTDIGLWKQLVANISVRIAMDGDQRNYKFGRPDMIPASGGTTGSGVTPTLLPGLTESVAFDSGFSNGWPVIDNYLPFPEPIIWTSAGVTDSNFSVPITLQRQQVIAETARAGAAGIAPYTPPTAVGQFGTFVDFMVRLHSMQEGARSVNS